MYKFSVSSPNSADYDAGCKLVGQFPNFVESADNFSTTEEGRKFKKIATADIHISYAKHDLGKAEANQLLYALLTDKPIILLDTPAYKPDVNLFSRETISGRLSKILVCDITLLDENDLHNFISNAARERVNYKLTRHEKTLIKSFLRSYLKSSD